MNAETHTILLAESDLDAAEFLAQQLSADGFEVVLAENAGLATRQLARSYPDLVIVNAELSGGGGFELLRALRSADGVVSRIDPATPALVIGSRCEPHDRVRAFERGGDDFVALPLHYPELHARVRSLLRRVERRQGGGRLRVGALEVDPPSREVTLAGESLALSQKEYALLRVLASEPTRVFSKEELLRTVWGYRTMGRTRTLDSHACRLRQKLSAHGDRYVVNVWGVGYRLIDGGLSAVPDVKSRDEHADAASPTLLRAA